MQSYFLRRKEEVTEKDEKRILTITANSG
jgi:hypothetical protein